jgi:putative membrane protein
MRTAALVLALLPATALAQIGNPGFMNPLTRFDPPGVPVPGQNNTTDQLFAQLAGEGGLAEVTLGELAAGKAAEPAVADFARRMVEDHTAANERLAAIAEASGIPLPDALSPEHEAMREKLEGLDGTAFDLEYMRGQVVDHQKTATLLIWEIGQGQNGDLQRFASATLPAVLDHLQAARALVDQLTHGQVAAADPPPIPR